MKYGKILRTALLLLLALLPLLFTSCVDYVQAITYKDGKYQMYYKVTFSKVLFALAEEDPEAVFESLDVENLGEMPEDAYVRRVDTDLEVGAEFAFSIDPRTTVEEEKDFLPKTRGGKCYIPFMLGQEDYDFSDVMAGEDADTTAMAQAMLSSAKCRIFLNKEAFPQVTAAYFAGRAGQDYAIPVYDYGDDYCLEVPFITLFERDSYRLDRIVVLQE